MHFLQLKKMIWQFFSFAKSGAQSFFYFSQYLKWLHKFFFKIFFNLLVSSTQSALSLSAESNLHQE